MKTTTKSPLSDSPISHSRAGRRMLVIDGSQANIGSSKAVIANSNETPCLAKFERAFRESRSNRVNTVYTITQPSRQAGPARGRLRSNGWKSKNGAAKTRGCSWAGRRCPNQNLLSETAPRPAVLATAWVALRGGASAGYGSIGQGRSQDRSGRRRAMSGGPGAADRGGSGLCRGAEGAPVRGATPASRGTACSIAAVSRAPHQTSSGISTFTPWRMQSRRSSSRSTSPDSSNCHARSRRLAPPLCRASTTRYSGATTRTGTPS